MTLEYVNSSTANEVHYDFEQLASKYNVGPKKQTLACYLIHEHLIMNQGLQKQTTLYLLEEIANYPGNLRVTQFSQINSEDEARGKLKKFISLRTMLSLIDRKGAPVSYQAEIQTKAKEIDFDANVVIEEDESSYDDNDIESVRGEIRGTEIGDNAIEEAKNDP